MKLYGVVVLSLLFSVEFALGLEKQDKALKSRIVESMYLLHENSAKNFKITWNVSDRNLFGDINQERMNRICGDIVGFRERPIVWTLSNDGSCLTIGKEENVYWNPLKRLWSSNK